MPASIYRVSPCRSVTHSSMACREHIDVKSSCLLGLSYKLCFLYETNFIFNLCLFYFSSPEINGRYRRQRKDSEDKLYLDDLWISCMNDGMDNGTNSSEFFKILWKYKGILIVGNAKTRHGTVGLKRKISHNPKHYIMTAIKRHYYELIH